MQDKYGVMIAGGQDELEGNLPHLAFRLLLALRYHDGVSCLEIVLFELGHKFTIGSGVGAALKTFVETKEGNGENRA